MTIFVGGVHAVGKTYVLKPVCESLRVRHATASQLIKEQRGIPNWTNSRQVTDIDENQQALIAAVMRLKQGKEKIVLDGHFVLRRSPHMHEVIGVETFSNLMVRGVILLEAPTRTVAERLLGRGDTSWGEVEIRAFAQKERDHAEAVCEQLAIPLVPLFVPSESEVRSAISKFIA